MPLITYRFDPDEPVCVFQMESPTGRKREVPLIYEQIEHQIRWHERMLHQVASPPAKEGLTRALRLLQRARDEWPSEVSDQENQTKSMGETHYANP